MGADVGLFLIIKMLRGDVWLYVHVGGNFEILSSAVGRVATKFIVDFTSLIHLRHPQEMGGANWLFSPVRTMASLPAVIKIFEYKGGDAGTVGLAWI